MNSATAQVAESIRRPALALVTGATQGIGLAIAQKLLAEGWQVAGTASRAQSLAAMARTEPRIRGWVANLAEREAAKQLATEVLAQLGTPALLVNNAGRFLPGAIHQEPDAQFELQMALNLAGPYYLTKGIVPAMIAAGGGTVVNICSTASTKAYPNGGSYSVSKHALLGLTKNLREELRPHNIRVVAVMPGPTLTASWAGTELPPSRFLAPQDVAEAVWMAVCLPPNAVAEDIVLRPVKGDV